MNNGMFVRLLWDEERDGSAIRMGNMDGIESVIAMGR